MARILVVDDEETIRYAFDILLADEGHTVTVAGSCEDALKRMSESAFDLVFADIVLGDGSGIDILGKVQELDPSCPVVMITGSPDIETASQAIRLSAFDYIPKPVLQRTLLDVTARALRHKALVDEKERYRTHLQAIFASVKDAVITVDRDLAVTEVNEAAAKICGLSRDAVGKTFGSWQRCSGGACLGLLATIVNDGKGVAAQRIECQAEGRPKRIVSIDASPLLDGRSVLSGAVLVVKDETRLDNLERDLEERRQFHNFIGKSAKMQGIYSLIEDLAQVRTTVLITGETGTGKELGAAALHHKGDRRGKPFVKVNCAALPESLLESELFGHVRGAFTGALQNKIGRFEMADGGTIFLDEIGDMSPGGQLRLLRVLQEKEFERVGDSKPIKVDVRIVAATNRDLREKVKRGEFRDDLYYRLKVVEIHLPPLRERKGDMPLLTGHFLKKFNNSFGREIASVSAEVQRLFMDYPWPGNVRELEHTLEHACIVCNQRMITIEHLPVELRDFMNTTPSAPPDRSANDREMIINALGKTYGNKAKAARLLGISRQTMYRRIEENRINWPLIQQEPHNSPCPPLNLRGGNFRPSP